MRVGNTEGKNFGWGRSIGYAGHNAVASSYAGESTIATHSDRWGQFCEYLKNKNITNDARKITNETLTAYAEKLSGEVERGEKSVSYAQNLLSSVNTVLSALREDSKIRISPSEAVGQRSSVRETAPGALDRSAVTSAVAAMNAAGHERAAIALELARELGLRQREALLIHPAAALREAAERGRISITEGTKGGRGHSSSVTREIPATPGAVAALERAAAWAAAHESQNLIANGEKLTDARAELNAARPELRAAGIAGYHDGRAGYACERYEQLTGHAAPVVAGERTARRAEDRAARLTIAAELGHGRSDVAAAYIGSAR